MTNKRILILIGKGKSTLTNFFVDENEYVCIDLNGTFDTNILIDQKYNIIYDSKVNYKLIKEIISGKTINIRRKYKKTIKSKLKTKFILHINSGERLNEIPKEIIKKSNIFYLEIPK